MFASIMRSLGYVPFDALVKAEGDLMEAQGAQKQWGKRHAELTAEVESLSEQLRVANLRNSGLATERTAIEAQRDDAREVAEMMASGPRPYVAVEPEPKRLTLRFVKGASDHTGVIIKQSVRNKANEEHFAEVSAACNELINKAWPNVATTAKRVRANREPAPAPLDTPTK